LRCYRGHCGSARFSFFSGVLILVRPCLVAQMYVVSFMIRVVPPSRFVRITARLLRKAVSFRAGPPANLSLIGIVIVAMDPMTHWQDVAYALERGPYFPVKCAGSQWWVQAQSGEGSGMRRGEFIHSSTATTALAAKFRPGCYLQRRPEVWHLYGPVLRDNASTPGRDCSG